MCILFFFLPLVLSLFFHTLKKKKKKKKKSTRSNQRHQDHHETVSKSLLYPVYKIKLREILTFHFFFSFLFLFIALRNRDRFIPDTFPIPESKSRFLSFIPSGDKHLRLSICTRRVLWPAPSPLESGVRKRICDSGRWPNIVNKRVQRRFPRRRGVGVGAGDSFSWTSGEFDFDVFLPYGGGGRIARFLGASASPFPYL